MRERHKENRLKGEALVDGEGSMWLPYDLPHRRHGTESWTLISERRDVLHAGRRPFRRRTCHDSELHLLNGMGVTLGDSVIGMSVLAWVKTEHPSLQIHLYRSPHTPDYVERLYQLANTIIEPVRYLPWPLRALPQQAIDLSDFLHWPRFKTEPMVDFFLEALGLDPIEMPARAKQNTWLAALTLPALPPSWNGTPYVLLCDRSSTPLRSVPRRHALALVQRTWERYRLPVVGFHELPHPCWHDVSGFAANTEQFMAWVKNARVVIGTDSSAIHVAAGFGIPTLAGFASINPTLRVRDYRSCTAVDLRTPLTDGIHTSDDPDLLREVDGRWHTFLEQEVIPWPEPAAPSALQQL
jgi:hypothetical protein